MADARKLMDVTWDDVRERRWSRRWRGRLPPARSSRQSLSPFGIRLSLDARRAEAAVPPDPVLAPKAAVIAPEPKPARQRAGLCDQLTRWSVRHGSSARSGGARGLLRPFAKQLKSQAGGERHDGDLRIHAKRRRDHRAVADVEAFPAEHLEVLSHDSASRACSHAARAEGVEGHAVDVFSPQPSLFEAGDISFGCHLGVAMQESENLVRAAFREKPGQETRRLS